MCARCVRGSDIFVLYTWPIWHMCMRSEYPCAEVPHVLVMSSATWRISSGCGIRQLRLVGTLNYRSLLRNIGFFCRVVLQKRLNFLRSLLIVATPLKHCDDELLHNTPCYLGGARGLGDCETQGGDDS